MEKHALALGYFFLSAFCVFACGHSSLPLQFPLQLAALTAALLGVTFFIAACAPFVIVIKDALVLIVKQVPLARELPPHRSVLQEDRLS